MSHQTTFLSLGCLTKRTRADRFLDEMNRVVPWAALAGVVAPHDQRTGVGRPLTEVELLLRLHCLQLWYNLSDPGREDAVPDRLPFQRFLGLDPLQQRVPDETTILNFRRLLEQHGLAEAIFARVNAGLAAALHLIATVEDTLAAHPGDFRDLPGRQFMLRNQPPHQQSRPRPVCLRPHPRGFDFLHQFFSERRSFAGQPPFLHVFSLLRKSKS